MEYLNIRDLIFINQYVQGIVSADDINSWFLSYEESDRQLIVRTIWQLAIQARVNDKDLNAAIALAKLKPTHTPVVMLHTGDLSLWNRGGDLSRLNGTPLTQALWLVLECLAVADRRRKDSGNPEECNHWWHKDLSNPKIIKNIIGNLR